MKQMKRPVAAYYDDLCTVFNRKERRYYLQAIQHACDKETLYCAETPSLAHLFTNISAGAQSLFLKLYSSDRQSVVALKERVRKELDSITVAVCQYCGLNEPHQLDHFVEKAKVPELSLYLLNIIPCCGRCNHDRGPTFDGNGNRRILHFYEDDIGNLSRLLQACIEWSGGEPAAKYSVLSPNSPLDEVYIRHFHSLKLERRYRINAGPELVSLKTRLASRDLDEVQLSLAEQINGRLIFGSNDHLVALYEALLADTSALDWLRA